MEILKIAILAIFSVFLAVELKGQKPIYAILLVFAAGLLMLFLSFEKINMLFGKLNDLFLKTNEYGYIGILIKAVGVCYLSEVSSGICLDAGFSSLASQIKMFAKVYIILLGLPILLMFIEVLEQFGG